MQIALIAKGLTMRHTAGVIEIAMTYLIPMRKMKRRGKMRKIIIAGKTIVVMKTVLKRIASMRTQNQIKNNKSFSQHLVIIASTKPTFLMAIAIATSVLRTVHIRYVQEERSLLHVI
jgi:hypothetical protein